MSSALFPVQPEILQTSLPLHPWDNPRTANMPGVNMLDWDNWVLVDEAYRDQMALKERLLTEIPGAVLADGADAATSEHLDLVLERLKTTAGYEVGEGEVRCPDGRVVPTGGSPLLVAARLLQQDICIMERRGAEFVLAAAALCFPSNWRLSEKLNKPMTVIHEPVPKYSDQIARVVGLMFDKMRPDRPMWRMNFLLYANAELHQPNRLERANLETGRFIRCERQTLIKLPETGAIAFGIHTYVVPRAALSEAEFMKFWDKIKDHYGGKREISVPGA